MKHLVDAVEKMLNGKSVILSDASLDWIGENSDTVGNMIRSLPNPRRVGILDAYICWIGEPATIEQVMARLA